MKRIRMGRLRRMSPHEWRWRGQDALHTAAERVGVRTGAARWQRKDVGSVLTAAVRDVCRDDIRRENWAGVQDALAAHIAARPARFVLDPSSSTALRDQVLARWPGAVRDAASRADRVLDGFYDLLGYRGVRARDGRVDWHSDAVHGRQAPRVFYADVPFLSPEIGDHKIIWELNRHQHWLQLGRALWLTGDSRYAQGICSELESWLADNPPYVGINWASMLEVGFRAISWTWALHCLLAHPGTQIPDPRSLIPNPWLIDMLVGLDRQLTHVERHLSYYFSPNTHLTGEALALYVAGTALPELAASHRWVETGRRILLHEIDQQILADGGHVERSTHYQRYTLDFYLLAALTARLGGDEAAGRRFEEAAGRLAGFTRTIADEDGRLPLIGDDDGGMLWPMTGRPADDVRDSLAVAAIVLGKPELAAWGVPEEALWIAGPRANALPTRSPAPRSCLLRETGYFVARDAGRSHAVVDAGPHGYQNGGHAHADALSLTLSIDGRPLLIDPGTSTYTMDAALRDRMRSTASHNTVTLDGRSQSLPDGPFHWRSTVDARVVASRINPAFDVFEAAHDGYLPARHRRTVVRTSNAGWLIVDAIHDTRQRHSAERHSATARWHFDPAWHVTASDRRLRATHHDGASVWMLCEGGEVTVVRGGDDSDGWCAPVYGQLVPASTARVNVTAEAPFVLVTWIGSGREFRSPTLRCTPMNDAGASVIVDIDDGARTATFLVRSADPASARTVCRVGEFETDAAMFHYVTANGRLQSISMIDGRHAISSHDAWPSVSADEPVPDVHVVVRDGEIDLTRVASALRRKLRVHGTAGLHIAPGERTRITT